MPLMDDVDFLSNLAEREKELAEKKLNGKLKCSIDNKDDCLMCGS